MLNTNAKKGVSFTTETNFNASEGARGLSLKPSYHHTNSNPVAPAAENIPGIPLRKYLKSLESLKTQEDRRRVQDEKILFKPWDQWKAKQLVNRLKEQSQHPNLVTMVGYTNVDGTFNSVTAEGCERLTLADKISQLPRDQETLSHIAMSVMRQLIEAAFYIEVVYGESHRDINPSSVLIQNTGRIKLQPYNMLNKAIVGDIRNRPFFFESPFVAPELRGSSQSNSVDKRMAVNNKADVWAIGAVILAILLGKTLLPSWNPADPHADLFFKNELEKVSTTQQSQDDDQDEQNNPLFMRIHRKWKEWEATTLPTEEQSRTYNKDIQFFNKIVGRKSEEWQRIIPNNELRYVVRRCLVPEENNRATLSELMASIYLIGGVQTQNNSNLSHPWSTPENVLTSLDGIDNTYLPLIRNHLEVTEKALIKYQSDGEIVISNSGAELLRNIGIMCVLMLQAYAKKLSDSTRRDVVEKMFCEFVTNLEKFSCHHIKAAITPASEQSEFGSAPSISFE